MESADFKHIDSKNLLFSRCKSFGQNIIVMALLIVVSVFSISIARGYTFDSSVLGETPGVVLEWHLDGKPLNHFSIPMKIMVDPGKYDALWETNLFSSDNSLRSGYIGFKTYGRAKKESQLDGMFVVTIFSSSNVQVGNHGAYCLPKIQQNEKYSSNEYSPIYPRSCRINLRPIVGHQYYAEGKLLADGYWSYSFYDETAQVQYHLGNIKNDADFGADALRFTDLNSHVIYFDNNDPQTTCSDSRYSKFLWGFPMTNRGKAKTYTVDYDTHCPEQHRITNTDDGVITELGPLPVVQNK